MRGGQGWTESPTPDDSPQGRTREEQTVSLRALASSLEQQLVEIRSRLAELEGKLDSGDDK